MKFRVLEGNVLHSGEIGEKYATEGERIFLKFANEDKCGYRKNELQPVKVVVNEGEKEELIQDILLSLDMIKTELGKNNVSVKLINFIVDMIKQDIFQI